MMDLGRLITRNDMVTTFSQVERSTRVTTIMESEMVRVS